ncbi:hypothetical protein [Halococcus salsus]|uniref:hypothetical protein n=1 Tax=Halococcus salsus TaxID=2162894 RepID=UPI001965DE11|nr:hypothetical protein [Halococcus salsus]
MSGDLGKSTARGATIDDKDTISGDTATGQGGGGGVDSYGFSGEIESLDFEGDATVYLDDDVIDPDGFAQDTLTIASNGGRFSYTVSVSGDLTKSSANGASIDPNDTISGSTATGQGGGGGVDSYGFSDEIESFDLDGDATVTLNGDRINPADYPDKVLSFTGNGDFNYRVSVSGNLAKSTANGGSINDEDTISGSTATGNGIEDGVDSYTFTGEIRRLDLDGDATITLNGETIEPDERSQNVISFVGNGDFEYTLATGGALEKSTANGGSINDDDTISGSTATGNGIADGVDSYVYSGDIEVLDLEGDATVTLNGNEVDPDAYPDNVLSFIGNGDFNYEVSVGGSLAKSTANGGSINDEDTVSGSTATGNGIEDGVDSYAYSGDIEALDLEGDATITLNGDRVDPDDYTVPGNDLSHQLSIVSEGGESTYSLTVSGDLEKSTARGASIDDNDVISGSTANGRTNGGTDSYGFSDELLVLSVDGNAEVYLDGNGIDPSDYTDSVISFVGNGDFEYTLATSGALEKSTANGGSINDDDIVSGSTATGNGIADGVDSYVYSGDIEVLDLEGDATVTLNGSEVDPDAYPDNVLSFIGNGDFNYEVSVSGSLAKSTANGGSINDEDTVSGSTATGNGIEDGVDSYTFTGEIRRLDLDGDATVSINGQRLNTV